MSIKLVFQLDPTAANFNMAKDYYLSSKQTFRSSKVKLSAPWSVSEAKKPQLKSYDVADVETFV